MRSQSILRKVTIILYVVAFGYLTSIGFVIFHGIISQQHLNRISALYFPASKLSSSAMKAFEQQVRNYEDAVLMGDVRLLTTAVKDSKEAEELLASITTLPGLPQSPKNQKYSGLLKILKNTGKRLQPCMDSLRCL